MSYKSRRSPERTRIGDTRDGEENLATSSSDLPVGTAALPTPLSSPEKRATTTLRLSTDGRRVSEVGSRLPKPKPKTFRASSLNCGRSKYALKELTLIRSRDDALLITEVPLTDGRPQEIPGYHTIHHPQNARSAIYIKDKAVQYIVKQKTSIDSVTIELKGHRSLTSIYQPCGTELSPEANVPLAQGEIRMGDFNSPPRTTRYFKLRNWMTLNETIEISPDEPTHDGGNKLDLILTRRDSDHPPTKVYHNGSVEHSDHRCQSVSFLIPTQPLDPTETKTDYKKIDAERLFDEAKMLKEPEDYTDLMQQLEQLRSTIETKIFRETHRLPKDLLEARRHMRRSRGTDRHQKARIDYRRALRDHVNSEIASKVDEATTEKEFFELNRRGITKKLIPSLTDDSGRTYHTHEELCDCLARHHGEGEPIDLLVGRNDGIPPVTHAEVTDAINKAPPNSTIGQDDIGLPLIKIYHRAKPTALGRIFTEILRSNTHPAEWKKAVVVPIPKANKATYGIPKAWRSIHLLSLLSKTLERVVLGRIQEQGEEDGLALGPTQFGSRKNTGTSDAMATLLNWKRQAEAEGKMVTLLIADVEGGFDKVKPEAFANGETGIDKRYINWIREWSANRRISFRFNGKKGKREYVTNRGIPQGSLLSPYLFGSYVRDIMYSSGSLEEVDGFLLISYVDDLLICIKGNSEEEMEEKTRAAWREICRRAEEKGMTFAENKTKIWHGGTNRPTPRWGIGNRTTKLRFLGYWIADQADESFRKHTKHWLTKANYAFNKLRALTQRTDRGLKTIPMLRILHSVVRTQAWYGLEFSGQIDKRNQEIDSFMYETLKRLLDMPVATPHRAISAEFALTPSAIQYKYLTERITHRHERQPEIMDRTLVPRTSSLHPTQPPASTNEATLPWSVKVPSPGGPTIRPIPTGFPTDLRYIKDRTTANDVVVYTDGSHTTAQTSYAAVAINASTGTEITHIAGRLSAGKTIADAETYAVYLGILLAMDLRDNLSVHDRDQGRLRVIIILTDSRTAIDAVTNAKSTGPLAYLNNIRDDVETHPLRDSTAIFVGWVKGHSKIAGNERADSLAKAADTTKDTLPGLSHTRLKEDSNRLRQRRWEEWFDQKEHFYTRRPSRKLKRHAGHSRLDTSILFRLFSNKGWNPEDKIGTGTAAPCTECPDNPPADTPHLIACPAREEGRPPNITQLLSKAKYDHHTVEWVRKQNHFGFKNRMYEVKYIRLKVGDYWRIKEYPCDQCERIFKHAHHLKAHLDCHIRGTTRTRAIPPPPCTTCGYVTRAQVHMDTHIRAHETGTIDNEGKMIHKPTKCTECDDILRRSERKKHYLLHHTATQCHGCSSYYSGTEKLMEHQRSNCGGSRS